MEMEKQWLTGLICAGIGALLLVLAAFSSTWIKGKHYDIESRVGLQSIDTCVSGSECDTVSLSDWQASSSAPKGLGTFIALGMVTFYLCLFTAFLLLVLLGYSVSGKTPHWPVHPGSLVLLLSIALLIAGVLTLALHPFKVAGWGTGPGFLILGAGDMCALFGSLILGRSAPLDEDEWFE